MNNIILIGFMGSGKTEVGKRLAKRLGYGFIDTDSMIEARTGKTIKEIFKEYGEPYFRNLEKEVVKDLVGLQEYVISTGGGIVADIDNLKLLKSIGFIVWLKVTPSRVLERVGSQSHRPLLNVEDPLSRIKQLLSRREPFYKEADLIIDTDNLTVQEVVEQIISHYSHGKG